jgi:uncharacterized protein YbjT (DUF2867 family)
MILVTDAIGRIGGAVVRHLAAGGHPTRAFVPSRSQAMRLESRTVEIAAGALCDQRAVRHALEGIDTVVMITSQVPNEVALQEQLVEMCRQAHVRHIVKLSAQGVAGDSPCDCDRAHRRVEQQLMQSGIASCCVRPTRLMQSLELQVPLILTAGILAGCQGHGRVADVDTGDVAAVLAALAVRKGSSVLGDVPGAVRLGGAHDALFEACDLTGPRALTRDEVAAVLSAQLGRHVAYVDCAPAQLLQCSEAAGLPAWQAQEMVAFDTRARAGKLDNVSPATEQILGRPARDFESFAHELAISLRYAQAPGAMETPATAQVA